MKIQNQGIHSLSEVLRNARIQSCINLGIPKTQEYLVRNDRDILIEVSRLMSINFKGRPVPIKVRPGPTPCGFIEKELSPFHGSYPWKSVRDTDKFKYLKELYLHGGLDINIFIELTEELTIPKWKKDSIKLPILGLI